MNRSIRLSAWKHHGTRWTPGRDRGKRKERPNPGGSFPEGQVVAFHLHLKGGEECTIRLETSQTGLNEKWSLTYQYDYSASQFRDVRQSRHPGRKHPSSEVGKAGRWKSRGDLPGRLPSLPCGTGAIPSMEVENATEVCQALGLPWGGAYPRGQGPLDGAVSFASAGTAQKRQDPRQDRLSFLLISACDDMWGPPERLGRRRWWER